MVPGSRAWGEVVFPVTTMLAPSRAHRSAISRPMPRVAPVMKIVFPLSPDTRSLSTAEVKPIEPRRDRENRKQ